MKKYLFIPAIVLIALCVYLPINTNAQTATKIVIYPTADSYVDSSNPDTNFGTSTTLNVSANTIQAYTYIKFDLSGIPVDSTILNANLSVNLATDIGLIYRDDKVGVYSCPDNSWGEQTITWNNKPATVSSPTSVWTIPMLFFTGYRSWDVTQDAKTALQSRGLTEVLKFTEKYGDYGCMVFRSKDGGSSPKLEIEYIPGGGGVTPTPLVTPTPAPVSPTPTTTVATPTPTPYVSTPTAIPTPSLTPTTTPNPATPTPTGTPPTITPTPKPPTPSPSIPEYSLIITIPLLISLLALAFILRLKRKS